MSKLSVLIVDDDDPCRMMLSLALSSRGFDVREAENGTVALELAREKLPDILLLDALMPPPDGFAVCKTIRTLPGGDTMLVIILTGMESEEEARNQALSVNADRVIFKASSWNAFMEEVLTTLDRIAG